jgi:hypothetical protein
MIVPSVDLAKLRSSSYYSVSDGIYLWIYLLMYVTDVCWVGMALLTDIRVHCQVAEDEWYFCCTNNLLMFVVETCY